jgi:hypothetical protein
MLSRRKDECDSLMVSPSAIQLMVQGPCSSHLLILCIPRESLSFQKKKHVNAFSLFKYSSECCLKNFTKMLISAFNINNILNLNRCFILHTPNYCLCACHDLIIPFIPGLLFILIYWINLYFHDMAQEYCGK